MTDCDDDGLSPEQREQRALFSLRGYVAFKARNHRALQARERGEPVEPRILPKPTPTVIHPELPPGTVLVYRIREDDMAVVIALERDAHRVDAIRRAIETARTWGEFRTMLPDREWSDIWDSWCLDGSDWKDVPVGEVDELRASLADDQPFDSAALPGYLDGDYPVWLQQKMLDILPADILDKYGSSSFHVDLRMEPAGLPIR